MNTNPFAILADLDSNSNDSPIFPKKDTKTSPSNTFNTNTFNCRKCNQILKSKLYVNQHLEEECLQIRVRCIYCSKINLRKNEVFHLTKCSNFPVICLSCDIQYPRMFSHQCQKCSKCDHVKKYDECLNCKISI